MKVERLAAIAEIVGAVAIVVTLAYLAIQTRQNTEALNSSARQASLDAELSLMYQLAEGGDAFRRTFSEQSLDELAKDSPDDVGRITWLSLALFRIKQHQWMQYQAGLFNERTWRTYEVSMCGFFGNRLVRSLWLLEADNLDPEFVAYTNAWLDSNPNCR